MFQPSISVAGPSTRIRTPPTHLSRIFAGRWRRAKIAFPGRRTPRYLSRKWFAILPMAISKCLCILQQNGSGKNAAIYKDTFLIRDPPLLTRRLRLQFAPLVLILLPKEKELFNLHVTVHRNRSILTLEDVIGHYGISVGITGHVLSFVLERSQIQLEIYIMIRQPKVVNEIAFQYYHRLQEIKRFIEESTTWRRSRLKKAAENSGLGKKIFFYFLS